MTAMGAVWRNPYQMTCEKDLVFSSAAAWSLVFGAGSAALHCWGWSFVVFRSLRNMLTPTLGTTGTRVLKVIKMISPLKLCGLIIVCEWWAHYLTSGGKGLKKTPHSCVSGQQGVMVSRGLAVKAGVFPSHILRWWRSLGSAAQFVADWPNVVWKCFPLKMSGGLFLLPWPF